MVDKAIPIIKTKQKCLKFSLSLPLSPERRGVRARSGLFLDS
jgi:hypothetical protein